VLALGAGGLLGLALLEGGLRLLAALRDDPPPHADPSVEREWRWAFQHLRTGQPAVSKPYVFDPALGWAPAPGQQDGPLVTNSIGMRGPREFGEARVSGVPRLVVVGDSYVEAFGMSEPDTFHAVLAHDYLPGWEVLNLGVSGYGVDQAVRRYEKLGARYRPDVAVLGFFIHDYFRNEDRFRSYAKPYFTLERDDRLALHDEHLIPPEILLEQYERGERRLGGPGHSYAWAALQGALRPPFGALRLERDDATWRLFAALLRRFRDDVRAHGGTPLLLIIPTRPERYAGTLYEELDRAAREEARALDLPVLALADVFHASPDAARAEPLYRSEELGGHLSVAGNREMARLLGGAVLGLRD